MEYIRTNLKNTERHFKNGTRGITGKIASRWPFKHNQKVAKDYCNIPHEAGHEETKNKGRFNPVGELDHLFKQGRNVQVIWNRLD